MKRHSAVFAFACFILGLCSGSVSAKWSLLEDYQMDDLAGDQSVCISSIMDKCDFDIRKYGVEYPEDDLNDDMDEARGSALELIFYDYSFKHPYVPFPAGDTGAKPVAGEPFFQSDWYEPGFSGWEKLCEKFLNALPGQ